MSWADPLHDPLHAATCIASKVLVNLESGASSCDTELRAIDLHTHSGIIGRRRGECAATAYQQVQGFRAATSGSHG